MIYNGFRFAEVRINFPVNLLNLQLEFNKRNTVLPSNQIDMKDLQLDISIDSISAFIEEGQYKGTKVLEYD